MSESVNATEVVAQFSETLARWALAECEHTEETGAKLYDQLVGWLESESVTRAEVIGTIARQLTSAPSYPLRYQLVNFVEILERRGYHCPELFWIVLRSDILFETNNVSDIAKISGLLSRIGGPEIVRSYLVTTLLTDEATRRSSAIMAFYPVGHTLFTISAIAPIVEESGDQRLLHLFYNDVLSFVRRGFHSLSEADRLYLKGVLSHGLSIHKAHTIEICQDALALLR